MKKGIKRLFLFSLLILIVCAGLEARKSGVLDPISNWIMDRDGVEVESGGSQKEGTGNLAKAEILPEKLQENENVTSVSPIVTEEEAIQEGRYYYEALSEEEKEVYGEIFAALTDMQETELSTTNPDLMEKIFQCVLNDHPELFYVEGYAFMKYTRGDKITRLTLEGTFTMSDQEAAETKVALEEKMTEILSGLPTGDDYEKIKYIYEYIIGHTEYNTAAADNQNICSVFLGGESVCQGYAKATQLLLQKAGIPSALVVGYVEGGEGHAWNLVKADGDYYFVDTTWGDASYRTTTEEAYEVNTLPVINYDYLCVTTAQLCKTHTIQGIVPMPECSAMKDNYYVREGSYFTELKEEQLEQLFQKSYEQQKSYITLQCADESVYGQMLDLLITQQKIFHFMDTLEDGVVAYAQNDAQYSLSFWLSE